MIQMLRLQIVHHFLHVINDVFVDDANVYIAMAINNLIEYSDNYSDTLGSLWELSILRLKLSI